MMHEHPVVAPVLPGTLLMPVQQATLSAQRRFGDRKV
jgi:hypothetical protein